MFSHFCQKQIHALICSLTSMFINLRESPTLQAKLVSVISFFRSLPTPHGHRWPRGAFHLFPAEKHALRHGPDSFHSYCFLLACKPPHSELEDTCWWRHKNHIIKSREMILRPQDQKSSAAWLSLKSLCIKVMYRIGDKKQPWWSPALIRNWSDLLQYEWVKLSPQLYRYMSTIL